MNEHGSSPTVLKQLREEWGIQVVAHGLDTPGEVVVLDPAVLEFPCGMSALTEQYLSPLEDKDAAASRRLEALMTVMQSREAFAAVPGIGARVPPTETLNQMFEPALLEALSETTLSTSALRFAVDIARGRMEHGWEEKTFLPLLFERWRSVALDPLAIARELHQIFGAGNPVLSEPVVKELQPFLREELIHHLSGSSPYFNLAFKVIEFGLPSTALLAELGLEVWRTATTEMGKLRGLAMATVIRDAARSEGLVLPQLPFPSISEIAQFTRRNLTPNELVQRMDVFLGLPPRGEAAAIQGAMVDSLRSRPEQLEAFKRMISPEIWDTQIHYLAPTLLAAGDLDLPVLRSVVECAGQGAQSANWQNWEALLRRYPERLAPLLERLRDPVPPEEDDSAEWKTSSEEAVRRLASLAEHRS